MTLESGNDIVLMEDYQVTEPDMKDLMVPGSWWITRGGWLAKVCDVIPDLSHQYPLVVMQLRPVTGFTIELLSAGGRAAESVDTEDDLMTLAVGRQSWDFDEVNQEDLDVNADPKEG